MTVYGVSYDSVGRQPIVLLRTSDGRRVLPIWIGSGEANAILTKLKGSDPPRPMTHDLLQSLVDLVGASVLRVAVTELRDNTYYAMITLRINGEDVELDSRPSDAIALAVRADAPIFAAEDVIEESAVEAERPRARQQVVGTSAASGRALAGRLPARRSRAGQAPSAGAPPRV
jgi:bifunctional DNase/RNase